MTSQSGGVDGSTRRRVLDGNFFFWSAFDPDGAGIGGRAPPGQTEKGSRKAIERV